MPTWEGRPRAAREGPRCHRLRAHAGAVSESSEIERANHRGPNLEVIKVHISRRRVAVVLALVVAILGMGLHSLGAAPEQVRTGGTLVIALNEDPPHLNAGISTDLATIFVGGQMYQTLVRMDADYRTKPSLAEQWSMTKDGLTYTVRLQRNVRWHDGRPFTSADVKYSLLEVNHKHNGLASTAYDSVQSIETPDPYTVVFRMKRLDPPFFPWALTQNTYAQIFPKHLFEGTDPKINPHNAQPVGNGPFKFREWKRGSHIILERNPDYYLPDRPYLQRLIFRMIPDPAARVIALERREIDYIPYFGLPSTAIDRLSKVSGVKVIDTVRPAKGIIIAFFNLRHPQLKVKEVRQAIAYAVDRQAIVNLALAGRARVATSPIRADDKEFYNPNVRKYEFNVAQANKMLDESGLPRRADATRFSLRLSFDGRGEGGALRSAAEVMREQLRAVGIDVRLQPMDSAAWLESAFSQWDFDMSMGSFATGPDPHHGVARLYITKNIQRLPARNLMGYSNPKVDDLFDRAASEPNPARRAALYREVQTILVEELPALWMWEKFYPIAIRDDIVGLPTGPEHSEPLTEVWRRGR